VRREERRENRTRVTSAGKKCAPRLAFALFAVSAILSSLAACDAPLTEVVVVVDSDLAVPEQLDEIFVQVEGASGLAYSASAALTGTGAARLPVSVGLRPGDDPNAVLAIRAIGRRDGSGQVEAEVRTNFVEGRRLLVRITLRASCLGVRCEMGETCRDGACVDPFVPPGTLPPFDGDGGALDGGTPWDAASDLGDVQVMGGAIDAGACTEDPGTPCELAGQPCVNASLRCESGAVVCRADETLKSAGTPCRPAAGACDVAEVCDGASGACPSDGFEPAGSTCRAEAGDCDAGERCDGTGKSCPANGYASSSQICRPVGGVCDVLETCTGTGPTCPSDARVTPGHRVSRRGLGWLRHRRVLSRWQRVVPRRRVFPSSTLCRAARGPCDAEEYCNGVLNKCPPDLQSADGDPCDTSACGDETCSDGGCSGGVVCRSGYTCSCDGSRCVLIGSACE